VAATVFLIFLLISKLMIFPPQFLRSFQQQDIQELNRVLCDKLEETMRETAVDGMIEKLFGGKARSYIKCLDVDKESKRDVRATKYVVWLSFPSVNDSFGCIECRAIHTSGYFQLESLNKTSCDL
jgi:hypothetical protein